MQTVLDREALKYLMTKKMYSQNRLGAATGLSQPYLSNLLSGKILRPSYHAVSQIASVLGVKVTAFMRKEEDHGGKGKGER